jgi:exonuclease III
LLINDSIKYYELHELSVSTEVLESIYVEIKLNSRNVIIGCMYCPPNANMSKFNDEIDTLLKELNKCHKHVYLMGDFNADLLRYNSHKSTSDFINLMLKLKLK